MPNLILAMISSLFLIIIFYIYSYEHCIHSYKIGNDLRKTTLCFLASYIFIGYINIHFILFVVLWHVTNGKVKHAILMLDLSGDPLLGDLIFPDKHMCSATYILEGLVLFCFFSV